MMINIDPMKLKLLLHPINVNFNNLIWLS